MSEKRAPVQGFSAGKKFMWAGIVDGEIYSRPDPDGDHGYSPVRVALFATEAAAKAKFERVVKIDTERWLSIPAEAKRK